MEAPLRCLSLLLVALSLGIAAAAQSPSPPVPQNCVVAGQVVLEPGGTPIRKVNVTLVHVGDGRVYQTLSDANGSFRIEHVAPGEYSVVLDRNGYIAARRKHRYSGSQFTLSPGEENAGLLFRMQPAGVVKGTIVDEDGDPLRGVSVAVLRSGTTNQENSEQSTNDLGEFRLPGLPDGKYLVLAKPQDGDSPFRFRPPNGPKPSLVYAPTYFPGTMSRAQAAWVEVRAGEEANASFSLLSSSTFRVVGTVSGLPSSNGPLALQLNPVDGTLGGGESTVLDKDGNFEVQGMRPGTYSAVVSYRSGVEGEDRRMLPLIEVGSGDVTGLRLVPAPTAEIRGHFRMGKGNPIDWSKVWVTLDPERRSEPPTEATSARVTKNGDFTMENVPADNYHILIFSNAQELRPYFVDEVTLNGRDVSDSGFSTAAGSYALEVVAKPGGAAVEGTVVDDENKPMADVQVVCIPNAARQKRRDVYQSAVTDKAGHFCLVGLNPGEYTILTLDEAPDDTSDPEFLKEHEGLGQTIQVEEGERKVLALKFKGSGDGQP